MSSGKKSRDRRQSSGDWPFPTVLYCQSHLIVLFAKRSGAYSTHTRTHSADRCTVSFICWLRCHRKEREREKLWWQEQHHSMPATTTHFDPLACSEIDFHNSKRWPLLLHWLISAPISSLSGHYPCPWLLQLLFVSLTLLRAICLFLALSVLCHLWPLNWQRRTKV